MQNSHRRLGRLDYRRSTSKTSTSVSVHVSHYIGEKEQAHLVSFFGNDAEVAAITAAIQENHRFQIVFPNGSKQLTGFGAEPSCYKGTLFLPGWKRQLRHIVAVSSWLHANGSAGRTFILNNAPQTQDIVWATLASLMGLPVAPQWGTYVLEEMRREEKLVPLAGIGCTPAVVHATREEMMTRIGQGCAGGHLPFPEANGPITWPEAGIKDALACAA